MPHIKQILRDLSSAYYVNNKEYVEEDPYCEELVHELGHLVFLGDEIPNSISILSDMSYISGLMKEKVTETLRNAHEISTQALVYRFFDLFELKETIIKNSALFESINLGKNYKKLLPEGFWNIAKRGGYKGNLRPLFIMTQINRAIKLTKSEQVVQLIKLVKQAHWMFC